MLVVLGAVVDVDPTAALQRAADTIDWCEIVGRQAATMLLRTTRAAEEEARLALFRPWSMPSGGCIAANFQTMADALPPPPPTPPQPSPPLSTLSPPPITGELSSNIDSFKILVIGCWLSTWLGSDSRCL